MSAGRLYALMVMFFASLLLASSGSADFAPGVVETRLIEWDGASRSYDVYRPSGEVPAGGLPVVFDFHGFTSTKAAQRAISGLRQLSDSEHFLMVWPQGLDIGFGNAWNAGTCCSAGVDDVGLVRAILNVLAAEASIDASRIYATGLSNGGAMSHRLACDSADLFASVSPVAFPIPSDPLTDCQPSRPISVGMVMGLTDTVVPYVGGLFGDARDSLAYWRDVNGCGSGEAEEIRLLAGEEKQFQRCETHTSCSEDVEVQLCSVVGDEFEGVEGHILYFNGFTLNVAAEIWGFMSRFQHPSPPVLPAPEPGSIALQGMALLSLLCVRRLRLSRRCT